MRRIQRVFLTGLFLSGLFTGCGGASDSSGPSDMGPPPAPAVASVVVTPATTIFATLGQTVQFTATARDASGNTISGKTFTWSSSDEGIATVSSSGLTTAVANGTATITATTDDVSGAASAIVQVPPPAFGQVTEALIEVVTDANGWATNRPKQRKVFAIVGRLWLFYSDGHDMKYVTSLDGVTWSAPTVIRNDAQFGHRFGLWYDGTHLHYAFNNAGPGQDVMYRRGVPGQDGTIAWQVEQVVFDVPPGLTVLYPDVVVEQSGEPWVSFLHHKGGDHTPPADAIVVRSTATDGNWATDPAFPITLVEGSFSGPEAQGVPLSDGTVLWLYNQEGEGYFAKAWKDGAWGAEEVITRDQNQYSLFSGMADGSDAHVTYGGGTVYHRIRRGDGSWTGPEIISDNASGRAPLTLVGDGRVVVTLFDEMSFEIREWSLGTWSPPLTITQHPSFPSSETGWNYTVLAESDDAFKAAVAFTSGSPDAAEVRIVTVARPPPPR